MSTVGLLPDRPLVLVTGAGRGVGRGIARAFGEIGATVYLTGRTEPAGTPTPGDGSVFSVAREIDDAGGSGIPVTVDHRDDQAVAELFAQIEADHGTLDVLVNNAFGTPRPWVGSGGMWEHPIEIYDQMHDVGIRSTYVATWHACRAMVARGRGAVVNVSSRAAEEYFFSTAYGVSKAATDKFTADLATELATALPDRAPGQGVGVFSVWPGLVRTEYYQSQVADGHWPERADAQDPIDVGRAILTLLRDPDPVRLSGQVVEVGDLLQWPA
ncbi:SDR family NAD(P)-dependent oxidoreductase [Nocardioides sp. GXZ039]|uniref:SDR family NAD(P)-dependent oxidoreductase n=1 Tax=Nocardioides sp. GXZ039 TaxID=3136018 RepID=UPI0030F3AB26